MSVTAGPYVGQSILRVEDRRLLTGSGCYAADFSRAGEVHARIVRSDVAHGVIRAVDVSRARGMPGVLAALSAQDLPDAKVPIRLFPTANAEHALQPVLAVGKVRYVGEPLAVIVAEQPYLAEDAADEVRVEIDALPPALDASDAVARDASVLFDEIGGNLLEPVSIQHHPERIEALFEQAAVVVSERLKVQRHGAVPLEPRGLLAEQDEQTGVLTVWGAAKVKHFNRKILADLLGREEHSVRCIEGDVGGGFGARGEFYPEDYLIPWLALQLRRPVKWVEDRRENLLALNHSREQEWSISYAAAADGTLLAFKANALFNQGAYVRTHGSVLLPELMLNHTPGPYRWQAYEVSASSVLSNKTPAGTYRGPGQYEPTFVRERMIDLVAAKLDIDPVQMRRHNLVTPADMPYDTGLPDVDTGKGVLYDDGDFPLVFESLLQRTAYEEMRGQVEAGRAQGKRLGLAATAFIEMGNPGVFEQARIVAEQDGTFAVHVGVASVGQGVQTALSQITADALKVPIELVKVSYHDTSLTPDGEGAFSSRSTVYGGNAITGAVSELHAAALAAAAEHLEIAVADLEIVGERVQPRGNPSRAVPMCDLRVQGAYRYQPAGGSHTLMGANVALVEVDPDSGEVKLLRYAIAYEVGKAVNPLVLEGQVVGAAAQGVGGALFEDFVYGADGQPLATSFIDYALPTAVEVPPMTVTLFELGVGSDTDPVAGVKGGGEGGIIAVGATVAGAVADALGPDGTALTELPIVPETVQALARAEAGLARAGAGLARAGAGLARAAAEPVAFAPRRV